MAMIAAEAGEAAAATDAAAGAGRSAASPGRSKIGNAMAAAGAPTAPPGQGASGRRTPRPAARRRTGPVGGARGNRSRTPSRGIRGVSFKDPRKIVLAEFVVCAVLVGLSPFGKTDTKHGTEGTLMQYSALCGVFFVLALMTGGKRSGNVAAAFGILVTLALIYQSRNTFQTLANFFGAGKSKDTLTDNTSSPTDTMTG